MLFVFVVFHLKQQSCHIYLASGNPVHLKVLHKKTGYKNTYITTNK